MLFSTFTTPTPSLPSLDLSSPLRDLLQNSPVREYTCSAQSQYCTLTITAIYTTPNESHEPAWLQGGAGAKKEKGGNEKNEASWDRKGEEEEWQKDRAEKGSAIWSD